MKTKTLTLLASGCVLVAAGSLGAHDLFLKLRSYHVEPNAKASVALLNGTFQRSDNSVTPDRMRDVSLAGPGPVWVTRPGTAEWRDTAKMSVLAFETRGPGTYVLGVSTKPRTTSLTGEEFDGYLEHDGLLDVLERRRRTGRTGTAAVETYSKHVKAVLQVGDLRTDGHLARFRYPVEMVPRKNPYRLSVGDTLPILVLKDGEPLAGQLVYASYEGYEPEGREAPADSAGQEAPADSAGQEAEEERPPEAVKTRTDQDGIARVELTHEGLWYARLIHMVSRHDVQGNKKKKKKKNRDGASASADSVDYVSKWATLTWEIRARAKADTARAAGDSGEAATDSAEAATESEDDAGGGVSEH